MIDLKGRKIALVGGAGFIGHNLALALKKQGADVCIIDSLQVNNLLAFQSMELSLPNRDLYHRIINQRLDLLRTADVPLYIQDCQDYHALSRILSTVNPQTIVHLAAVAHAGKSNKDPYSTFGHSLRTLENTLDTARGGSCEHLIFFSSSMVYGNFLTEEVPEDHPLNPIGIYGALKLAGEKFVIAYNQVFGLPYTIIRPSALYGPRCVSRRVIQIFIENAFEGRGLKMEGGGSEKLDFTYIDDLVDGIILTIQHPKAKNQIFNITNGAARPLSDVVKYIKNEFPEIKVEDVPRDNLMPVRGTLSISRARELLGYEPKNQIEVGVPKYIEWYKGMYGKK